MITKYASQFFKAGDGPEINESTEAEALLSKNLVCQVTGIVYKVEEFRSPVLVTQCYNCQSFGHSAKNCRSKQKCLIG